MIIDFINLTQHVTIRLVPIQHYNRTLANILFINNYGGKHAPGNMAVNTRRTVIVQQEEEGG